MVNWISLLVPFAYLGILVTSLATFLSLYKRRKLAKSLHLAPYFPAHTSRDVYLTLIHTDTPKPPDSLLRSALLLRACENIRRILTIRTRKPALQTLLARGSVGDDLMQRLVRAEKELEEEVRDTVNEANALAKDWGQTIFQSANEMVNREILHERLGKIRETEATEKDNWEKRRQERRADALKDLGADPDPSEKIGLSEGAPVGSPKRVETRTGAPGSAGTASDDDAVLVEKESAAGNSAAAVGGGGGGGGNKKKKKHKK